MKSLVLKIWGMGASTDNIEHWIVDIKEEKKTFMKEQNLEAEDFDESEFWEQFYEGYEDNMASVTLIELTPENVQALKKINLDILNDKWR